MGYRSLRECVDDLADSGQLVRVEHPIDARLEAAEIQRRVYRAGGPAIYFANVVGCRFPMVCNLFGTLDRARYIFCDALRGVQRLIQLKIDPTVALRHPLQFATTPLIARTMLPRHCRTGPVLANEITIDQLPQQVSWPEDGGAFVTLPQVYTEDVERPGWRRSNLGMYRVQLSGGSYEPSRQVGLHYQIHRGIGVHHEAAIRAGKPFRVNIFVGGPPAMTVAAVMPLPENMSELTFAGALGGRRVRMIPRSDGLPIHADADFCITGTMDPARLLPEGPFGDHLGYYSLAHDFPVLQVERVYHRPRAIWPFTVVGRPPQEDSTFGELIHELTGPVIPTLVAGVRAVHAVDAAGVHPLLLALGSERYAPYHKPQRPQELLTQANALLGQGQLSLAKYLLIVNYADAPELKVNDIEGVLRHLLQRIDWQRDLHFQTCTTIDTLDYSGSGLNEGSKLVMAAVGPARRELPAEVIAELRLPEGFSDPRLAMPGVLVVRGPACSSVGVPGDEAVDRFCRSLSAADAINQFPLIVVVDDSQFTIRSLDNFLWVTFTRSNPAADVHGIDSFVEQKHWGCRGSLVIDARTKPHHAPPLVEDPEVTSRVDALAAPGGPLHGVF